MQGGEEAEEEPGREREPSREEHRLGVQTHVDRVHGLGRQQCADPVQRPLRDDQAGNAAERRQQARFGEQLSNELCAAGADRETDRHFAGAGRRTGEQQVRDVRAGDDEHERRDPEEQRERSLRLPPRGALPSRPGIEHQLAFAEPGLQHPVALNVGNPHVVFFVENADRIDLDELGPRIEHDPVFPERINVNVAEIHPDGIRLRTWERGSGITRACGTGASATAVAAILTKRVQSPVKVTMRGGSLTIAWEPGQPIRMRGGATYVFKGEIDLETLA